MADAILDCQRGEDDQRGNLDYVDGHVDGGGSTGALGSDPGDKKREEHCDQGHEDRAWIRAAHDVWPEEADDISAKDACRGAHYAGIDQVVKMRAPADDELGNTGVFKGLVFGKQRLLGVI